MLRARTLGASKMCPFRFACRNGGYKIMLNYAPFLKQIGPDREMSSDRMSGREAHRIFFCFNLFVAAITSCAAPARLARTQALRAPFWAPRGYTGLILAGPWCPSGWVWGHVAVILKQRVASGCRQFRCRGVRVAKKALTPTFCPGSEREILLKKGAREALKTLSARPGSH